MPVAPWSPQLQTKAVAPPETFAATRTVPVGVASTTMSGAAFQSAITRMTCEFAWPLVTLIVLADVPKIVAGVPIPVEPRNTNAEMPRRLTPPATVDVTALLPLPAAVADHR